jgi:hypothetical protein
MTLSTIIFSPTARVWNFRLLLMTAIAMLAIPPPPMYTVVGNPPSPGLALFGIASLILFHHIAMCVGVPSLYQTLQRYSADCSGGLFMVWPSLI